MEVGDVRPGSQLADVLTESAPFEIGDTRLAVNGNRVYRHMIMHYEIDHEVSPS